MPGQGACRLGEHPVKIKSQAGRGLIFTALRTAGRRLPILDGQKTFMVSSTALVRGTSCVRNRSVRPSAASTAKNGSAQRTSSPKYSNAWGRAWQIGKPSVRNRNVFRKTVI